MKNLILLFILIASLGKAQAANPLHALTLEEVRAEIALDKEAVESALKAMAPDEVKAYYDCKKLDEDNCENDLLGDIY